VRVLSRTTTSDKRHGTTTLFAALDRGFATANGSSTCGLIDRRTPKHLIVDNYATARSITSGKNSATLGHLRADVPGQARVAQILVGNPVRLYDF